MGLVEIKSTHTLNLTKSDRDLDKDEVEAEEKAVSFPISKYKRIKPVPGTLAYLFRNLNGRNDAVIEFLRTAQSTNNAKFIKNFLILWNNMDEYSQSRLDIFDWLCRKYDVPVRKFFGVVQEGMFDYEEFLQKVSLSGYSQDFIDLVKRMAKDKRNIGDRKIAQEMLGLSKKEAPLIQMNDNSKHESVIINSESNPFSSFAQSMRKSDEGIRDNTRSLPENKPLALSEGNADYIDGELLNNDDLELVERHSQAENELMKEAKRL